MMGASEHVLLFGGIVILILTLVALFGVYYEAREDAKRYKDFLKDRVEIDERYLENIREIRSGRRK